MKGRVRSEPTWFRCRAGSARRCARARRRPPAGPRNGDALSRERLLRLYKEVAGSLAAQGQAAVLDRLVHELDAEHPCLPVHEHPRLLTSNTHVKGIARRRPTSCTSSTSTGWRRAGAVIHPRLEPGALFRRETSRHRGMQDLRRPLRHTRDGSPERLPVRPLQRALARGKDPQARAATARRSGGDHQTGHRRIPREIPPPVADARDRDPDTQETPSPSNAPRVRRRTPAIRV